MIEPFCAGQTGIVSRMVAEIRAEIQLQRWAGLRIGDSIALSRFGLVGNRISLTTQKTGYRIERMVIPDDVAAELAALPVVRLGLEQPISSGRRSAARFTRSRPGGKITSLTR